MRSTSPILALALALAAQAALAQQAGTGTEAPAEPATEAPAEPATDAPSPEGAPAGEANPATSPEQGGMAMGTPVAPDGNAIGSAYIKEEHQDWDIRCIRTESGNDPCQLYQLLEDGEGNAVAEFAIFPLIPAQGDAVAGGTIIAPLETLLTQSVTVAIDGGEARRYPFTFCTEIGCVARVGYASPDVDRFKRGAGATVTIVPVRAPDQRIALDLSLSGFTAGWDSLVASVQQRPAASE